MKKFVLLLCVLGLVYCDDIYKDEEPNYIKETVKFVDECGSRDLSVCIKERALKFMDSLPDNVDIGAGIKIKAVDGAVEKKPQAALPEEARARSAALDQVLLEKFSQYLSSHTLEFKLPSNPAAGDFVGQARGGGGGGGGGGGKKGGDGGGKMLMMLMGLKAATLGAIALKVIGIVAFKALIIAKIALTIAGIIALKKLLHSNHHSSTYEVVAHPHHYEDHHGHYDRSFSQELAYKGHEKPF